MFIWRDAYQLQWTIAADCLCIKGVLDGEHFVLAPIGDNNSAMEKALDNLEAHFSDHNWPFKIRDIERSVVNVIKTIKPGYYTFTEDRSNFDYVYRTQDLIHLSGRSYHSKKNHVNTFRRLYSNYQYYPLTEALTDACIAYELEWCKAKGVGSSSLILERNAIIEALNNFNALKLTGGIISIAEKIVAFTIGQQLNDDTAVIHMEKANPSHKGLYATINQEFCRNSWRHFKYINRQEDLGIPGLRKAKESYHPVKLIEKYIAVIS
jgi:hypothetical protein